MSVDASGEHVAVRPRRAGRLAEHQVAAAAHAAAGEHRLERGGRRHRLPQRHRVAQGRRVRPADRGARLARARGHEPASTRSRTRCCWPAATAGSSTPSRRSRPGWPSSSTEAIASDASTPPRARADDRHPRRRAGRRARGLLHRRLRARARGGDRRARRRRAASSPRRPPPGTSLYYYTFAGGSEADGSSLDDAGDGSAWSAAHARVPRLPAPDGRRCSSSTTWC